MKSETVCLVRQVPEMLRLHPEMYFHTFCMPVNTLEKLFSLVEPFITKRNDVREPISARERLQVTLVYVSKIRKVEILGAMKNGNDIFFQVSSQW